MNKRAGFWRAWMLILASGTMPLPKSGFAKCPDGGNRLTVLRWSTDGNSAVMIGYFKDRVDFIVIEGRTKKVSVFPFSVMEVNTYDTVVSTDGKNHSLLVSEPKELSPAACVQSMNDLNALLIK